jgi:hypothetical protein
MVVAGAVLGGAMLVDVAPAVAQSVKPFMCAPDPWTQVDQVGSPTYQSLGPAAGKYNASTASSTLSYALTKTTTRSSSVEAGGSMSLGWAIAKVELSFSYTVTSSTTTGTTVTDTVVVPGHDYGYDQPKVEVRRFHVRAMQYSGASCAGTVTKDYGYVDAITTYPFFSSCVAKAACTPKP